MLLLFLQAFSSKYFQKNTITSKSPHHQTLIGNGFKISFRDAKLINKMYSCASKYFKKNCIILLKKIV